jgi:tetratricopeptide (TPR) repeat protein
VLAACGWDRLVAWLERAPLSRLRSAPASAALLALVAVPGLLPLGRSIGERLRTDPRVEMSRVIERSLAADEAIAAEPGAPWIDPVSRQVIKVDLLGRARAEVWRRRGVRYLIATGRETYLPPGSPDSLLENRRRIEQTARMVWRNGPYAIFDLGEGEDAFNRARRLLAAGRAEEARRTLEDLCRVDSTNSPAVMLLGDARLAQGDTTAAVDAYLLASRLDETDPVPFLAMGSIALESRRWDAAVAAFLRARTLSPRDPIPVHNLSTALLYRAEASFLAGGRGAAARDLVDAALLARLGTSIVPEEARFRQLEAKTRELSVRWGIPLPEAP